ncbi:MAG TPA: ribonuclease HI [Anaerolineae bacterium]|nr:ribonuclease HI [Anaerolineae bacterium]
MSDRPQVTIYTDGGALGNPGPGGYGVVMLYNQHRKELSGGYRRTTNNRMELMAAISALEKLKTSCDIVIYTDSRYVADSINLGWARRWRANGWRKNKSEQALNPDLWERLLDLLEQHQVRVMWVKGHAGNAENERCDLLSVTAARQTDLPVDEVYERSNPKPSPSRS